MSYLNRYFHHVPEKKRDSSAIAYYAALDHIHSRYPLIAERIAQELRDQRAFLKLIASENFSSLAVQLAMGNLLTDKYSEGYPFHRFYAGCDNVDVVEEACVEEAKRLFQCEHAYVQPHSGADANLVAFWAVLVHKIQNKEVERLGKKNVGELTPEEYERVRTLMASQKMMGMSLNSGGHLTHGYRLNVSSKIMQAVPYEVDPKTGLLDYAALKEQVQREKPLLLIAGYSAYPRRINFAIMREIADSVGATLMVDMAHFAGLVAGKAMQEEWNPVPYAHIITSTTHKTLRGPRGGLVLCTKEYREVVDKGCPIVLGGPLQHVIAAKAIAFREANTPEFQAYARQVIANAQALAERLRSRGVHVLTGGTENHLILFDVAASFGLTGKQAECALREAGMTVNRNAIPFDPNGAWFTSGVRIGTPAMTTLGMKEGEAEQIADFIFSLLKGTKPAPADKPGEQSRAHVTIDGPILDEVKQGVGEVLRAFPLYQELPLDYYGSRQKEPLALSR